MVKIRSKIKFLKTSFFYELVKLKTLKKIFVMCHSIFALPIPPPGLPWVKMKMRMQFREWGSSFSCSSQRGVRFYSDGLPRPGGGMGNAKIEWHIREKNFSKFPFRPIRIKMLVSKFWVLTNFYLVNFSQLNQKCGLVSSSSNSFVLSGKKIIKSFHFVQFGKNCVFWNCLAENGRSPPQIYVGFLRRGLVSNHRLDSSFYWKACKALVIIWNLIMVWDVSRMVRVINYHHDNESSIPSRGRQLKHYLSIFWGIHYNLTDFSRPCAGSVAHLASTAGTQALALGALNMSCSNPYDSFNFRFAVYKEDTC